MSAWLRTSIVTLCLAAAAVSATAALNITVWTHPVAAALERLASVYSSRYSGTFVGYAEHGSNSVDFSVITDLNTTNFSAAVDSVEDCTTATTWICENRTTVDPVAVVQVITWGFGNRLYCAARCDAMGDFYAFVAHL